jgi:low affinity Fe/Cu permease
MTSSPRKSASGDRPRREGGVPVPHQDRFSAFAKQASSIVGKPATFLTALAIVVLWAGAGPFFGFSETWQIVINTVTTIITFLIVFLIQNTQNRDTLALQVKLAEIILHMPGAPNRIADAEDMSEHQLERLHDEYKRRARSKGKPRSGRRRKRR